MGTLIVAYIIFAIIILIMSFIIKICVYTNCNLKKLRCGFRYCGEDNNGNLLKTGWMMWTTDNYIVYDFRIRRR